MARNKPARTVQATADSFDNFMARVGMQQPNQHSASTYRSNFTSRNRVLIERIYRSSWIIGEAVDAIPDDMTRKGIRITSEIDAKDRGVLEAQMDELQIWDSFNDVLKWSRLYGGAVGFIMIEGQAPFTPLRMETIGKGKFKGILPLDRWMINPVLSRRIKEMGPDLGKPEFYDVVTTATGIPAWRIHHSRLIRFDGVSLPYQQKMTENEWGMSVVERIWDRLTAYDSSSVGAAQLVYKAHLRTYSVENLRGIIAMGGPAYEALLKNVDLIRLFQSNEGMTLMDGKDKFETHQYSFSGLDDILSQFAEQISGAVGIPLVRLFGQSPKGFSTGDTDLANHYDRVSSLQSRRLRLPMRRVLDIMHRSTLSKPLPDDFTFEFNPLWQMSDVDRSTVAVNTTNAISTALADGLMTQKAAMTDLRENSDVTGIGTSITDEDIKNAEDTPPPRASELDDPLQNGVDESVGDDDIGELNGAQISSMVEIVTSVSTGTLPRDSGIQMLMSSYQIDRPTAEKIMGSVGNGFTAQPESEDKKAKSSGRDPVSDKPTADSAGSGADRKWPIRWFKRQRDGNNGRPGAL